MKTLVILLIVILPFIAIWCLVKSLKYHMNVKEIKKALSTPSLAEMRRTDFVINRKTGEVEADNRIITPF